MHHGHHEFLEIVRGTSKYRQIGLDRPFSAAWDIASSMDIKSLCMPMQQEIAPKVEQFNLFLVDLDTA